MFRTATLTAASLSCLALCAATNAASFVLAVGDTVYQEAGATVYNYEVRVGSLGLADGARVTALTAYRSGEFYAAVTQADGSADMYRVYVPRSGDAGMFVWHVAGVYMGDLVSQVNSFDFSKGYPKTLVGTRDEVGSASYFEAHTVLHNPGSIPVPTPANDIGSVGVGNGRSFSALAAINTGTVYAIESGSNRFYAINRNTGAASDIGLALTFDGVDDLGPDGYGEITIGGADFVQGVGYTAERNDFYLAFYSDALAMAVIGTVNLTTGDFTETDRVDIGGVAPMDMGFAMVVPTPLAGGIAAVGLGLLGSRRHRKF